VNKPIDVTICFRISAAQEWFFNVKPPQNDISAAHPKALAFFYFFFAGALITTPFQTLLKFPRPIGSLQ